MVTCQLRVVPCRLRAVLLRLQTGETLAGYEGSTVPRNLLYKFFQFSTTPRHEHGVHSLTEQ